jgi:hypothetical protein
MMATDDDVLVLDVDDNDTDLFGDDGETSTAPTSTSTKPTSAETPTSTKPPSAGRRPCPSPRSTPATSTEAGSYGSQNISMCRKLQSPT